jgi:PIN domain nuclease of toxin-antitoxin system
VVRAILDTHVLVSWIEGKRKLRAKHRRAIEEAREGEPLLLSDISLWEIANLVSLGRIRLALPLRDWLEAASAPPLVRRCEISPAIASEVAGLPESFPRDPADRSSRRPLWSTAPPSSPATGRSSRRRRSRR